MLINVDNIVPNSLLKNNTSTINKDTVFVIGAIIALANIAIVLFFILLYNSDDKSPANIPFIKHIAIVIIGCIDNIVAPVGSRPVITIIDTTTPNDNPRIMPYDIPYIAPPIIIGIKLNVIGKPAILIYDENICRIIVITINIVKVIVFFIFIIKF